MNMPRFFFHVGSGLLGFAFYQWFWGRTAMIIALSICAAFLLIEDGMRKYAPERRSRFVARMFKTLIRCESEFHKISASTWYVLSILFSVIFFPKPYVCLGILVLALGDPMAGIFGKNIRSPQILGKKTLAGSLGFCSVAFIVTLGFYLSEQMQQASWPELAFSAFLISLSATFAELIGEYLEDNATIIPVVASVSWFIHKV